MLADENWVGFGRRCLHKKLHKSFSITTLLSDFFFQWVSLLRKGGARRKQQQIECFNENIDMQSEGKVEFEAL